MKYNLNLQLFATQDSLISQKGLEAGRNRKEIAASLDANFVLLADAIDGNTTDVNGKANTVDTVQEITAGLNVTVTQTSTANGAKSIKIGFQGVEETTLEDKKIGRETKASEVSSGEYLLPLVNDPETNEPTEVRLTYIKGINQLELIVDGLVYSKGEQ
jgi:hypothetical protein